MKKFLNLSKWGMLAPLLVIFALVVIVFAAIRAKTNGAANNRPYFSALMTEFSYFFQS